MLTVWTRTLTCRLRLILQTMVANRPKPDTPKAERSTLIVVPASLVSNSLGFLLYYNWIPVSLCQWEKEIDRHAGIGEGELFERFTVFKQSKRDTIIRIRECDIVLTSYWELSNSCVFPKRETMRNLTKKLKDNPKAIEEWIEDNREHGGPLHKINWYRVRGHSNSSSVWCTDYWHMQVILDEAVSYLIGKDVVDLANLDVIAHDKESCDSTESCCKCN